MAFAQFIHILLVAQRFWDRKGFITFQTTSSLKLCLRANSYKLRYESATERCQVPRPEKSRVMRHREMTESVCEIAPSQRWASLLIVSANYCEPKA